MQKYEKAELYEAVKDLLSNEEFEKRVAEEIEEYGGLIDENAAAMVVVDKLRSDFFSIARISELEPSDEATLYARVEFLGKVRSFEGGRVADMVISDGTGSCMLVLWDSDTKLIEDGKIKKGQMIKIINGYVKNGYYGTEVNIGKWGLVETELKNPLDVGEKAKPVKLMDVKKGISNIEVKIKKIHPTRIFFTERGERFAASIIAEDESGERKIILWDEMARELQKFKEGDTVKIERVYVKNGELHAGDISAITPKK